MEYTKITWNSDILLNRQEYYHGTQKYAFHKNKTEQIHTLNNNLYIFTVDQAFAPVEITEMAMIVASMNFSDY